LDCPRPQDLPIALLYRATRGLFFAIVGGFVLGHGLDRYFHATPWFTLAAMFSGIFLGFFVLIRAARTSN